jgi:threonylcarbamoyladenosine tRNA methylthiotransferase MtaB
VTVAEPAPAPKVAFKTLGCRLNQAESEQALEALGARGFDLAHAGEQPDVVVINTCTVTAESTASSRRLIRKTAEAHPGATVVVTGCYAVAEPEEVRALPGVDLVVGNDHKDRIAELVTAVPAVRRLPLLMRPAPTERLRTRVAVKAQTGCDEWCTFCIIPRTRGPLRSHPEEQVVADVRRQVERGVREVVLTGVHLGKYGEDRGEREALARLVDRLTAIDGLLRLRLSSVLPVQVTPALVERVRDDPKVCRHLHVPLQAGDDEVLARMHRPYRIAEFLDRVEHAKAEVPGLGLSTDVIVGFPGETRAQFAATMAVVERVGFSKLHVFRYSQRPDTPAATMPDQVPVAEKKARARELIALGGELRRRFHEDHVGRPLEVLVEAAGDGVAEGTSDNYVKVRFPGGAELVDRVVTVRGLRADAEGMEAELMGGAA